MIRSILLTLCMLLLSKAALAECAINQNIMGAKYKMTRDISTHNKPDTRQMILWRNTGQVAHEYPQTGITQLWEQTSHGKLRLVQYFDQYGRGIEYQPEDIKSVNVENAWEIKRQLVSQSLINSMKLESSQGNGCEKLESYSLKTNDKTIILKWLPEQKLVKFFSETSNGAKQTLELQEIIAQQNIALNSFKSRANFHTTDYIDIGDNESDPFLMKMINLGFIEHGASGFYDAQGNQLGKHHHH